MEEITVATDETTPTTNPPQPPPPPLNTRRKRRRLLRREPPPYIPTTINQHSNAHNINKLKIILSVVMTTGIIATVSGLIIGLSGNNFTLSLLMIGVGVVLLCVGGVGWRFSGEEGELCFWGSGGVSGGVGGGRGEEQSYSAMTLDNSLLAATRDAPPSYTASMQEYRLRLLLWERSGGGVPFFNNPPPPYYLQGGGAAPQRRIIIPPSLPPHPLLMYPHPSLYPHSHLPPHIPPLPPLPHHHHYPPLPPHHYTHHTHHIRHYEPPPTSRPPSYRSNQSTQEEGEPPTTTPPPPQPQHTRSSSLISEQTTIVTVLHTHTSGGGGGGVVDAVGEEQQQENKVTIVQTRDSSQLSFNEQSSVIVTVNNASYAGATVVCTGCYGDNICYCGGGVVREMDGGGGVVGGEVQILATV